MFVILLAYRQCLFRHYLRTGFSDYFGSTPAKVISEETLTHPALESYHMVNNVYIDYFFITPVSYCTPGAITMMVESCMFYNCSSGHCGGAVFFECTNGQCAVVSTCFSRCYVDGVNDGQSVYLYSGSTSKNLIEFVSTYQCSPDTLLLRRSSIFTKHGAQTIKSINSSWNIAEIYSCIYCYNPTSLNISFSTFFKNTAIDYSAIYIYYGATPLMMYCNFIGNNSPSSTLYGCIHRQVGSTIFYISYSIFQENLNILFSSTAVYISVTNSWIQHQGTRNSGSFTPASSTTSTLTQTMNLSHIRTFYCHPDQVNQMEFTQCPTLPDPPTACQITDQGSTIVIQSLLSSLIMITKLSFTSLSY